MPVYITLTKDNHTLLKKKAKQKGVSMTQLLNDLVEQIGLENDDEKIILSVPKYLTKNRDELEKWLMARVRGIVRIYQESDKC